MKGIQCLLSLVSVLILITNHTANSQSIAVCNHNSDCSIPSDSSCWNSCVDGQCQLACAANNLHQQHYYALLSKQEYQTTN